MIATAMRTLAAGMVVAQHAFGLPRSADHCSSAPSREGRALVAANERASATRDGTSVIDVIGWFCADGVCPVVAVDTLVRVDDRHITNAYSERLVMALRSSLSS